MGTGSASLLLRHGRGIGSQDASKKDCPIFLGLRQETLGSIDLCRRSQGACQGASEKSGTLWVGGIKISKHVWGFPGGSVDKESAHDAGDLGSILGLGRSPGEGHGTLLQNSCLENPMARGAGLATVCGLQRVRHD